MTDTLCVCALLSLLTIAGFGAGGMLGHGFLQQNNDLYVRENPVVRSGLSWEATLSGQPRQNRRDRRAPRQSAEAQGTKVDTTPEDWSQGRPGDALGWFTPAGKVTSIESSSGRSRSGARL